MRKRSVSLSPSILSRLKVIAAQNEIKTGVRLTLTELIENILSKWLEENNV
jgi:hypothetical protein